VKTANDLTLPNKIGRHIERIIFKHRMHWEGWAESAESYQTLLENLKKRGYKEVMHASSKPLMDMSDYHAQLLKEKLS
jgi:hypothetical protein